MKKRPKLLEELDIKLNRSVSVIDKLFMKGTTSGGLKAGDSYHRGDLSILKTSQLLWAMSSASTHSRTNQNREDLRQFLLSTSADISNHDYFNRTFNLIFALLALTAESQNVMLADYIKLVELLLSFRNMEGSWGFHKQGPSSVRATAMACFTLTRIIEHAGAEISPYDQIPEAIISGKNWLFSVSSPEGTWGQVTQFSSDQYNPEQFEAGVEVTAWCILALCEMLQKHSSLGLTTDQSQKLESGIRWLIRLETEDIATRTEIEEEKYMVGSGQIHNYEAPGLEITILAALSYRICTIHKLTPTVPLTSAINRLAERLLRNERDGHWYCKNCGDYRHLWTIAYAVYTLTSIRSYILGENTAFRIVGRYITELSTSVIHGFVRSRLASAVLIVAILAVFAAILGSLLPQSFFETNQNHLVLIGIVFGITSVFLSLKGNK